MSLADVYESIRQDPRLDRLRAETEPAKLVPGRGNSENPKAMIVVDKPSASDTNRGVLWGTSQEGKTLIDLMNLAGLSLENSFLTAAIKYRTPGNRFASSLELKSFERHLLNEWQAIDKPLIITVGGASWITVGGPESWPSFKAAGTPQSHHGSQHLYVPMLRPSIGLNGTEEDREMIYRHWDCLPEEMRLLRVPGW